MTRLFAFAALFATAVAGLGGGVAMAQDAPAAEQTQAYTALRPGLWEIRTNTRMQNMPYELPPVPYTAVQCLTQELLNNQQNLAAVTATRGKCDIHNVAVSEARTSWEMTCFQNQMEIEAKGTITPISLEAYTGNVYFTMVMPNANSATRQGLDGVVNVQGLWQGECTGSASEVQAKPTYRAPVYIPE